MRQTSSIISNYNLQHGGVGGVFGTRAKTPISVKALPLGSLKSVL